MKRILLNCIVGSLLSLSALTFAAAAEVAANAAVASEQRISQTVQFLASDELEGRGPGTKGIDKAAEFLAAEFAKLGLKTDLFDGQPFQKFSIPIATEMGPAEKNVLKFVGPPGKEGQPAREIRLELGKDFTPLAISGTAPIDAPLVFVGYGITAKEKDWSYDDYAGVDVKGKVVVILRKEPQQEDEKSKFNGKQPSPHALFNRKSANASEHEAAAIIYVNDALELKSQRERMEKEWSNAVGKMVEAGKKYQELKEPSEKEVATHFATLTKLAEELASLGKELAGSPDFLLKFKGAGEDSSRKIPIFFITRQQADELLKASGGSDLTTVETEIDADLTPRSRELTGWKAVGETNVDRKQAVVRNVIASLEGEGPLADETIVIGAHYDHLGFGGPGSLAAWTTEIHNGADDNASGTATLLEMAHRLATSGKKFPRRIVFMAFTAEERGLLGSAHYTRNPRFALEKTVAMFNLDMVGRMRDDKLIVYGTGTAKEFEGLVDQLGEKASFKLTKHAGGFGPSDHSSFYAKKIPVLHLFTGTHAEYHRPSDDSPLLNVPGMRRIADLLEEVVLTTATTEAKPTYIENKKVESIGGDPVAGDRPYFGSIPDYGSEEEGVALTGVQPDSPAAKAGLKAGDVIVKFGESKVTNIEDFMGAMMKFKPGDKVKVGVKRGKEVLLLDAVMEKRK